MGCLKLLIRICITLLAIIGVISIVQGNFSLNFGNNAPKREVLIENAKVFGDFSKLDSDYKIGNTINFINYQKVTISYTPSGQKTAFLHLGKKYKLEDFKTGKATEDLTNFYEQFKKYPISIQNFKITGQGTNIISGRESRYINFEYDMQNFLPKHIKGQIGAYTKGEDTILYFVSGNSKKISYKINSEILSKIKI